jgi:hypothetical protein
MSEENEYFVSVNGYHTGIHKLVVKQSPSNKEARYISGYPFGCSRDYVVLSDEDAIRRLMNEHSSQIVAIKKIRSREAWSDSGRVGFNEE